MVSILELLFYAKCIYCEEIFDINSIEVLNYISVDSVTIFQLYYSPDKKIRFQNQINKHYSFNNTSILKEVLDRDK